ncbi:unnamed protein product [Blepharisma stoltei]|uniref:Uncharacterized protein n=1 Tax=Blepharisma stoltei TaxID=1481888 RepID=A0AAU9ILY5_9CILI|nr:unnamed protein product [Blepharisma stoltei]
MHNSGKPPSNLTKRLSPKPSHNLDVFDRLHSQTSKTIKSNNSNEKSGSMHVKRSSAPIISSYQIYDEKLSLKIDTHVMPAKNWTSRIASTYTPNRSPLIKDDIGMRTTPKFHLNLQTGHCFELQSAENHTPLARTVTIGCAGERINYEHNPLITPRKKKPDIYLINDFC